MKKVIGGYAKDLNDAKLRMKHLRMEWSCEMKECEGARYFECRQINGQMLSKHVFAYVIWVDQPNLIQYFTVVNFIRSMRCIMVTHNYDKLNCLKDD